MSPSKNGLEQVQVSHSGLRKYPWQGVKKAAGDEGILGALRGLLQHPPAVLPQPLYLDIWHRRFKPKMKRSVFQAKTIDYIVNIQKHLGCSQQICIRYFPDAFKINVWHQVRYIPILVQ